MANIGFYGSHNGGIAVEQNGKYTVVEFERLFNGKNLGLAQYKVARNRELGLKTALLYLQNNLGIEFPVDVMVHSNSEVTHNDIVTSYKDFIPATKLVRTWHHRAHAASSYYQSNFDEAVIISYDGGGDDGFFNVFTANRKDGLSHIGSHHVDMGFPYMIIAHYLEPIKQEWIGDGNLVYGGKIMGLCNYGQSIPAWEKPMRKFYMSAPCGETYIEKVKILSAEIGVPFNEGLRLTGEIAYNLAATSQKVFEDIFFEIASPYFIRCNYPIILTGGCALNILVNQKVKEKYPNRKIFVAPNSNDCGIALGFLLDYMKPKDPVDVTYGGPEVFDRNTLSDIYESRYSFKITPAKAASLFADGKIVGVVQGGCEHGPRALGHRSIMCNPSFPQMKDILNAKVKNREWYRPFAPVVRLEEVSTYFEWEGECRHMLFCPKVKPEWRDKLSSITHVDGTARVQTITREQNEWLYDVLTELKKLVGHGVLLNTSFNVAGKPILNTYRDALVVLDKTQMDFLILEDILVHKS